MTNTEAINVMEIAIAEVEWEFPMDYAAAFDVAIEALRFADQLVHCGECQFRTHDPETDKHWCKNPLGCMGCVSVLPNDFYSRGKRRADDEQT